MSNSFDKSYWEKRYSNSETGWDIGHVSTPIKVYIDQLQNKSLKILIPGCGNAYEAEYLFDQGFRNVFLLDLARQPLQSFKEKNPNFPDEQLVCEDFFSHDNTYDLIIEQTFFCALDPSLRTNYAKKMSSLLKQGGKLVGLLFNEDFGFEHPPFGGTKDEYLNYFKPHFNIKTFEIAYNSIQPRERREFFVIFEKK